MDGAGRGLEGQRPERRTVRGQARIEGKGAVDLAVATSDAAPRPSETAAPRLVQVSVADFMGTGDTSTGRWELTTIEGHRLRVLTPLAGAELEALLGALVHGRGRR